MNPVNSVGTGSPTTNPASPRRTPPQPPAKVLERTSTRGSTPHSSPNNPAQGLSTEGKGSMFGAEVNASPAKSSQPGSHAVLPKSVGGQSAHVKDNFDEDASISGASSRSSSTTASPARTVSPQSLTEPKSVAPHIEAHDRPSLPPAMSAGLKMPKLPVLNMQLVHAQQALDTATQAAAEVAKTYAVKSSLNPGAHQESFRADSPPPPPPPSEPHPFTDNETPGARATQPTILSEKSKEESQTSGDFKLQDPQSKAVKDTLAQIRADRLSKSGSPLLFSTQKSPDKGAASPRGEGAVYLRRSTFDTRSNSGAISPRGSGAISPRGSGAISPRGSDAISPRRGSYVEWRAASRGDVSTSQVDRYIISNGQRVPNPDWQPSQRFDGDGSETPRYKSPPGGLRLSPRRNSVAVPYEGGNTVGGGVSSIPPGVIQSVLPQASAAISSNTQEISNAKIGIVSGFFKSQLGVMELSSTVKYAIESMTAEEMDFALKLISSLNNCQVSSQGLALDKWRSTVLKNQKMFNLARDLYRPGWKVPDNNYKEIDEIENTYCDGQTDLIGRVTIRATFSAAERAYFGRIALVGDIATSANRYRLLYMRKDKVAIVNPIIYYLLRSALPKDFNRDSSQAQEHILEVSDRLNRICSIFEYMNNEFKQGRNSNLYNFYAFANLIVQSNPSNPSAVFPGVFLYDGFEKGLA